MRVLIAGLICVGFLSSCSNSKPKDETELEKPSIPFAPQDVARIISPQPESDTLKGSLKAKGTIGNAEITINYYSPAVRGRIIGGVSYRSITCGSLEPTVPPGWNSIKRL